MSISAAQRRIRRDVAASLLPFPVADIFKTRREELALSAVEPDGNPPQELGREEELAWAGGKWVGGEGLEKERRSWDISGAGTRLTSGSHTFWDLMRISWWASGGETFCVLTAEFALQVGEVVYSRGEKSMWERDAWLGEAFKGNVSGNASFRLLGSSFILWASAMGETQGLYPLGETIQQNVDHFGVQIRDRLQLLGDTTANELAQVRRDPISHAAAELGRGVHLVHLGVALQCESRESRFVLRYGIENEISDAFE
nr:hypothetical protein CFP56_57847 [Quercus suber]